MASTLRLRVASRVPLLQVAKTSVATVLAWIVASLLFPAQLPIFAAIAALLVVQPSVNQSLGRAIERSVGVTVGVIIALGIGLLFGDQSWIVLVAIVVAISVGWIFRFTPASANQIPISAMLVLAIGAASPAYAAERIIETIIGAAIGLIVNALIVPPVALAPAKASITLLANEVADSLDRLSVGLQKEQTRQELDALMIQVRLLRPMQDKAQVALSRGEDSLMLNPRRSAHRSNLEELGDFFSELTGLVTRTIGMTRAFHDHYDASLHNEPTVRSIAVELERSAHDLRLIVRSEHPRDGAERIAASEPALTAPIRMPRPHPEHWILIGSLLEDMRRIRETIVGD